MFRPLKALQAISTRQRERLGRAYLQLIMAATGQLEQTQGEEIAPLRADAPAPSKPPKTREPSQPAASDASARLHH